MIKNLIRQNVFKILALISIASFCVSGIYAFLALQSEEQYIGFGVISLYALIFGAIFLIILATYSLAFVGQPKSEVE